jgi:hypothetical protein
VEFGGQLSQDLHHPLGLGLEGRSPGGPIRGAIAGLISSVIHPSSSRPCRIDVMLARRSRLVNALPVG